jgi:hypothetical protein
MPCREGGGFSRKIPASAGGYDRNSPLRAGFSAKSLKNPSIAFLSRGYHPAGRQGSRKTRTIADT